MQRAYKDLNPADLHDALERYGGFELLLSRRRSQRFLGLVRSWHLANKAQLDGRRGAMVVGVLTVLGRYLVIAVTSPRLLYAVGPTFAFNADCEVELSSGHDARVTVRLRD